jgi:hypothetical protein
MSNSVSYWKAKPNLYMILHPYKKESINPLLPWHPIGITQQSIVQPKGKQKAKQQRNGVWCILIIQRHKDKAPSYLCSPGR